MALSFAYRRLGTVDEALAALAQGDDGTCVLAGGTALLPRLRDGAATPSTVLDLKRIPGLDTLAVTGDVLAVGALVSHRTLETSALVREHAGALSRLCARIASVQVRNFATIGGNLCAAEPFSDLPYLLAALGAQVELRSLRGTRTLPVEAFVTGARQTARATDELLTRVLIPLPEVRQGTGFARIAGRAGLCAPWIGAAARVTLDAGGALAEARIFVGAVGAVPQRVGGAEAASAALTYLDDDRCAPGYKQQVAGVVVRRALDDARRDALER